MTRGTWGARVGCSPCRLDWGAVRRGMVKVNATGIRRIGVAAAIPPNILGARGKVLYT
jgi:hypothetical protein